MSYIRLLVEGLRGLRRRSRYPVYPESSSPFISTDLWPECASIVIEDHRPTFNLRARIRGAATPVVFIPSWLVRLYLPQLVAIDRPYRLLTVSNDDPCVPFASVPWPQDGYFHGIQRLLASPQLLSWHTKNPSLAHPKLHALPIGPKWQWDNARFHGEPKGAIHALYRKFGLDPASRLRDDDGRKRQLIFCCFGDTTPAPFWQANAGLRPALKRALQGRFQWSPAEPFPQYLDTLSRHRFALSPPGRGIDAHRTWEALMVGTIPVVQSSPLDPLYEGLPVVVLRDWDLLTPDFLDARYAELRVRGFDFSRCYAPYWKAQFGK